MKTIEHLRGEWLEWRHNRVAVLSRPYGWTSLVSQDWLHEGENPRRLDGLPGSWAVVDNKVIYTPDTDGPNLSVDGEYPTAPVEIVPGRNLVYGHGNSVAVYFGDCEVESIHRTNEAEEQIFAIRKRDPKVSAARDFSGVVAWDYNPRWRVPASFTPSKAIDVEAVTVETGVRETTTQIGTLHVELDGKVYDLVVIGKNSVHGVVPNVHIRDLTSGRTTYGAGRLVEMQFANAENTQIDTVDFNYLMPLPCAFTSYVTCPLAPPQNFVNIEIDAGEKKPAEDIERIMTYAS